MHKEGMVKMVLPIALMAAGSLLIALYITMQIRINNPSMVNIVKYNAVTLPLVLAGNILLGISMIRIHSVIRNFPFVISLQSFIYYIFIVLFSLLIIKDRLVLPRTILGLLLVIAGAAILHS